MNSGFVQLVILLADDMILLSSATVIGLQIQMKSLFIDGSWLQLQVNMNKSNIVVFTKGIQMPEKDGFMMTVMEMMDYVVLLVYCSQFSMAYS